MPPFRFRWKLLITKCSHKNMPMIKKFSSTFLQQITTNYGRYATRKKHLFSTGLFVFTLVCFVVLACVLRNDKAKARQSVMSKRCGATPTRYHDHNLSRLGQTDAKVLMGVVVGEELQNRSKKLLWIQSSKSWRRHPESNRGARICSPLRNHSAMSPLKPGFISPLVHV